MLIGRAAALACVTALAGCAPQPASKDSAAPYLLVFAGDEDKADSDFLAVLDLQAGGNARAIATAPIGMKDSMPHHMEYSLPPRGELLFVNAHHHEKTLLIDLANPRQPLIAKTLDPPPPFRFPHDFYRMPTGTRLAGFLRSEGPSPYSGETAMPGNHGGIAEYSADGKLLRQASAAAPGFGAPVRPYAFAYLPDIDRVVVTSAAMMEETTAHVVQVFRYSDFALLTTVPLPEGKLADGSAAPTSYKMGFGPRVLADGSVFFNAYGCGLYRLSNIAAASPMLETLTAIETPPREDPESIRGACGIPIVFGHYWIQPAGRLHAVLVFDISSPSAPREVMRLATPEPFRPHWLARDPESNRLVLGAEFGGEEGMYLLRFDDKAGALRFDDSITSEGRQGYLSLKNQQWPHGNSGTAWGHAALFLPRQ